MIRKTVVLVKWATNARDASRACATGTPRHGLAGALDYLRGREVGPTGRTGRPRSACSSNMSHPSMAPRKSHFGAELILPPTEKKGGERTAVWDKKMKSESKIAACINLRYWSAC